jgi:hypothetical protein
MLTAEKAAEVLNEALKLDQAATSQLLLTRSICNDELADHPKIYCRARPFFGGPNSKRRQAYSVGMLGLLNGILASAGSEKVVSAVIDDADPKKIVEFQVRCRDGSELNDH